MRNKKNHKRVLLLLNHRFMSLETIQRLLRMWLLLSKMLNDIYRSSHYFASDFSRHPAIFNSNKSNIRWLLLLHLHTSFASNIHIIHSLHFILFPRWHIAEPTKNTNCYNMCISDINSNSFVDNNIYSCDLSWWHSLDWLGRKTSSWRSKPAEWKERK